MKKTICFVSALLAAASQADAFVARAPEGASKNAERILSEIAKPMTAPVPRGIQPPQVARQLCGRISETYLDLLMKANPGRSLDAAKENTTFTFPACFVRSPESTVEAKSGETVKELADRIVGVSGERTLRTIYNSNLEIFRGMGITSFEKGMVATATLPAAPLVVLNATAPAIYELKATAPNDSLKMLARETNHQQPEDSDLVLESSIPPGAGNPVACDAPRAAVLNSAWPFDPVALEHALLRNDTLRAGLGPAPVPVEPVTLAVADNGMDGILGMAFPAAVFAVNAGEVADDRLDNDGNGFRDDLVGVNVFDENQPVPLEGQDRWHGTHIAGLVLGGPAYRARTSSPTPRPRVKLLAISMVQKQTLPSSNGNVMKYPMPPNGILKAIDYAVDRGARVINLSVSTKEQLPYFNTDIARRNIIVVVAAGNQGTNYQLDNRFPAAYGGQVDATLERPVITVAAHNRQGCLTPFSGRSKKHVDLAAPGVSIESNTIGGGMRTTDGTSQATALVSFTAALLRAEGVAARAIKRRLLASADFNPDLEDYVLAGGTLNIVKAVSRYDDLVQTGAGLERGQFDTAFDLSTLCPGVAPGTIIKIFRAATGTPLRVLLERNRSFVLETCTPTITTFGFRTEQGRRDVPLADVLDVVPRG